MPYHVLPCRTVPLLAYMQHGYYGCRLCTYGQARHGKARALYNVYCSLHVQLHVLFIVPCRKVYAVLDTINFVVIIVVIFEQGRTSSSSLYNYNTEQSENPTLNWSVFLTWKGSQNQPTVKVHSCMHVQCAWLQAVKASHIGADSECEVAAYNYRISSATNRLYSVNICSHFGSEAASL